MLHLIPAPLHRALLPLAHRVRRRWRQWRKAPLAGVSMIVTRPDGAVLLVRHSYGSRAWSLPGGGLGRGEEPAAGARRELGEELGLTGGTLALVAEVEESISASPHTAYLFHCVTSEVPVPDGREVVEARFFARAELPEPITPITRQRIALWRSLEQALEQG